MYKVENIFVRVGRIVSDLDVTEDKVKDLLKRYSSIRVVLSNPSLDTLVVGELQDNQYAADYAGTLAEMVRTGNISRLDLKVYDETEFTQVLFKEDLWEAGYDIEPVDILGLSDDEDPASWPDLKITGDFKGNLDLSKNNLLSVNGLIHPLSTDEEGSYALGANTNILANESIEMSLLRFKDVGNITLHSVSCGDRVNPHTQGDIYQNGIYVKLNADTRNKVIGLVFLGHLHLLDGVYEHFNDDVLHISLKKLDLETKIINHHAALGMKDVGRYLRGGLGRVDLRNPSLIDYVMNNRNTFLFTLDIPLMYRQERVVTDEGLPCVYSSGQPLSGIAQYADNLMAEYRQEHQDGLYCLQVPERPSTRMLFKTTDYATQQAGAMGTELPVDGSNPALSAVDFFIPT